LKVPQEYIMCNGASMEGLSVETVARDETALALEYMTEE
jgi:hypothetical protein